MLGGSTLIITSTASASVHAAEWKGCKGCMCEPAAVISMLPELLKMKTNPTHTREAFPETTV